jgi:histidine triad (HIT) family protein
MNDIFDKIIAREIAADIVYEDEVVIAFLDKYPLKKGHTLIVPKVHCVNIFDAEPIVLSHMMVVAQKIAQMLTTTIGAKGVNLHMNNGPEAGQDILHTHLHVIPRFVRGEAFAHNPHETYADGESEQLAVRMKGEVK